MTSCKDAIKDIEVDGKVAAEVCCALCCVRMSSVLPALPRVCAEGTPPWLGHDSALCSRAQMEEVRLCPISNMKPLITKMDNSLSSLKKCKHLRMSSNNIGKIEGIAGCDSLQILSLARNSLKKLEGLNEVADTLVQLWISYNQIGSLAGIEKLTNLQVLYASNNRIDKWSEVERLQQLPVLRELNLVNNPLHQKHVAEDNWRIEVIKRLPNLKNLDGSLVDDEEREMVSHWPARRPCRADRPHALGTHATRHPYRTARPSHDAGAPRRIFMLARAPRRSTARTSTCLTTHPPWRVIHALRRKRIETNI